MFRPTDRWMRLLMRCLSWAVLLALSIAVPNLSPRCGFASEKPNCNADTEKESKTERPPFDLTYVPPGATGIIAVRPNAIFANPAMKPLARIANESSLLGMMLLPYIPFADLELPIQEIEQVILYMLPVGKQPSNVGSGMVTVMIRAAHDFDWLKLMQQIDPQTKEERCGDRVYYRSHPKRGKGEIWSNIPMSGKETFAYFIPDKRTLVLVPTPSELRIFRTSETTQRPQFSWDKDWKHVEHDLMAYAQVNRQDSSASKKQIGEDPFPEWTVLTQKVATMVAGVDWKDGIALQAYLAYKESAAADRAIQDLKTFLKQSRRELMQDTPDVPEPERRAMAFQVELWKRLYDGIRINRRESTVYIQSKAKMTVAEAVKGLLYQFDVPSTPETAPARK